MDDFQTYLGVTNCWKEFVQVRRVSRLEWCIRPSKKWDRKDGFNFHFERDCFPSDGSVRLRRSWFGWYALSFRDENLIDKEKSPQTAALWLMLNDKDPT